MLDYDPPLSWWAIDNHDEGGKEFHPRKFVNKEIKDCHCGIAIQIQTFGLHLNQRPSAWCLRKFLHDRPET